MTKLDKEKLRKELIEVYENFDKGNYSKEMKHKAVGLDILYGGATRLLDDDLAVAINYLIFAIQPQLNGAEKKEEVIKKILKRLKE